MSIVFARESERHSSTEGPKVPGATVPLEPMGYFTIALADKLCLEGATALGPTFRLKRACGKTTIGSHLLKCESDVESVHRPNQ